MGCSPLGFPVLHYIRVCSNLCPLSQWCHKTISSYVALSPSSLNLSYHQGLFQWVSSLHQVAKVMELQLQHQTYQWIFSVDFLQAWLVLSPCCPRDSEESSFSRKIQFKSISSSALSLFMVQLSYPYMTTGKTVLWLRTIVSKVISLIFNLLFLTAFFFPKEQVSFNFVASVTIHSGFRNQENKLCHCFNIFLICLPWSDGASMP